MFIIILKQLFIDRSSVALTGGPLQKPWLWTKTPGRHLLCYIWGRDRCKILRTQAMWRPKRQLSVLLNFFFPFIDIWYFVSQVLNFTFVELNRFAKQVKLLKKPLFQERRWSFDFPPRKTLVTQKWKAPRDFPPRKDGYSSPPPSRVVLELSSPSPRVCTDGRTRVRWRHSQNFSDLVRLPNLLSNGAPLARWRAGSAIILILFYSSGLSQ